MDEARGRSGELVSPVVSPSEAGKVAFGMVGSELSVGFCGDALDVAGDNADLFEGHREYNTSIRRKCPPSGNMGGVDQLSLRRPRPCATTAVSIMSSAWRATRGPGGRFWNGPGCDQGPAVATVLRRTGARRPQPAHAASSIPGSRPTGLRRRRRLLAMKGENRQTRHFADPRPA